MAKIPFDIKFRPQIESGEYKVETEDGNPVVVMDWDWNHYGKHSIAVKVTCEEKNLGYLYSDNGDPVTLFAPDLFLVTPEPEMSEWELAIAKYRPPTDSKETIQRIAAELLSLARKQLQPEIDAEIEKAYKNADEVQHRKGREEALKDLPRWNKCPLYFEHGEIGKTDKDEDVLSYQGYRILLSDLAKLPKED